MNLEKNKPKRKLPKKSQRPKRRYILFSMEKTPGKQAFERIMSFFSPDKRKEFGIWLVAFEPMKGKGILRCKLSGLEKTRAILEKKLAKFGGKTLRTSGTLKALKAK